VSVLLYEVNALYVWWMCWGYKFNLPLVEDDCLMWPHDN